MSIAVYGYGASGKEESELDGFPDLTIDEQISILRHEMWEWMTGRSFYSPSSYSASDGPIPKKQAYAYQCILTKALMIETLLKLKGET